MLKSAALIPLTFYAGLSAIASPVPSSEAVAGAVGIRAPILPLPALPGTVNLRIEGKSSTIFEGLVISLPGLVTTPSGGTHLCNGENNGANSRIGSTPTTALAAASKLGGKFSFDGTFSSTANDFSITAIGDTKQAGTQSWSFLVNYQYSKLSGCQYETKAGDNVLWAFNALNVQSFLELSGPLIVFAGVPFNVAVINGMNGAPFAGASVGGATTNARGIATITTAKLGILQLKASGANAIRSNRLSVLVI